MPEPGDPREKEELNLDSFLQRVEENIDNPIFQGLVDSEKGYAQKRAELASQRNLGAVKGLAVETILGLNADVLRQMVENPWLLNAYYMRRKKEGITKDTGREGSLYEVPDEFFPRIVKLTHALSAIPEDKRREFLDLYLRTEKKTGIIFL